MLAIIENTNNIKHKCIVSLLYSAGLRRGELINLKISDIDSKRMLIRVADAKGNKDRYTLLSIKLLTDLRQYYRKWCPGAYLFEGPGGEKYSSGSIAKIINGAAAKAGIGKHITPHMLRHSVVYPDEDRGNASAGKRHRFTKYTTAFGAQID